jgi:hypothetical protein
MLASEMSDRRVISDASDYLAYAAAWLAFAAYLLVVVRGSPKCLMSSLYQVYYFVSVMVGTTSVALGARMTEIKQAGFANGAFWMLLICVIVTLEAIRFGYQFAQKLNGPTEKKPAGSLQIFVALALLGGVTAVSLAILYVYGSPLTSGVNRILFWSVIAPPFLSPIRILIFLTFFLACCLALTSKQRSLVLAGRVFFLIYVALGVVLLGEKASLFIIYLSAFLFVLAAASEKIAISKIGFVIGSVAVAVIIYAAYTYETSGLGAEFVFARFALQAQIPWSVLLEPQEVIFDGLGILDRALDFTLLREEISGRYLPASVLAAHSQSGTSLTGFMPSWQILFFGASGAIFLLIGMSMFLGYVQFHIVEHIRQGKLIMAFVLFSAHFQMLSIWYVGNFNVAIILAFFLIVMAFMYLAPQLRFASAQGEFQHAR